MNVIDPRTIILISGVMGGLMSMVLFFMHRSYPVSIAGLREWAWSLAILFLAGVLASLGGMASPWLANIAPNALICCGMYLAFVGSRRFFGQAVRHAGHFGLIAFVNLLLLWFTVAQPWYLARVLILTALLAYLTGAHAWLVLRQSQLSFSHWFVGTVLCLASLNEVVRLVTALTLPVGDTVFDRQPQNLLHITLYPFLMLLMAIGMVLLATDRVRAQMQYLATHDSLTNTLTRRHMNETCEQELARCRRHGRAMALLTVDLDHFKTINDTHGHQVGDRVLIRFVATVNTLLRRGDELGRFGGEEFVVLLPETALPEALLVAERIRAACQTDAGMPPYTVSIGVAAYLSEADTVDSLLGRADAAMYRAKAGGRNQVAAG